MSDNHKCECSHDHDCCECEEHTMKLVLDDGSELECSVIDIFELAPDRVYIALLPLDEDEVLIYKYLENEDGSFELLNIESDEEFEEVEEAFLEIIDEDDEEFED